MSSAFDPAQVRMNHLAADLREATVEQLGTALTEEVRRVREQLNRANTERQRLAEELSEARAETQEIAAELAEERTLHQQTLAEAARLRAVVERVRAVHSPEPGWEREWTDPADALAKGWPRCAGCQIEGVAYREIGDCPTLRALNEPAAGEDGTDADRH